MGVSARIAAHRSDLVTRALVAAVERVATASSATDIAVAIRESVVPNGAAVTIVDADEIDGAALTGTVVTVGSAASADLSASDIRTSLAGTEFTLLANGSEHRVALGLVGERYVLPALAAIAVGIQLGVDLDSSIAAVESVHPVVGEMSCLTLDGVVVIDDSGDTGTRSTTEALKSLAEIAGPTTRSIAVLGELSGVGADARDEHDRIGRIVVRLNVSQVIVVGTGARHLAAAAGLEGSWDGESVLVETAAEAYDLVRATIREGDVVLVKVPGLAAELTATASKAVR
jgi:UDP-N-acetylmuramoyl-tripeptide--D-alanyl-D-alanine ligase